MADSGDFELARKFATRFATEQVKLYAFNTEYKR